MLENCDSYSKRTGSLIFVGKSADVVGARWQIAMCRVWKAVRDVNVPDYGILLSYI